MTGRGFLLKLLFFSKIGLFFDLKIITACLRLKPCVNNRAFLVYEISPDIFF